ncbi:SMI1/KNR4 family protein [Citrobacter sp. S2-9]|uniref:SMI1/KNR4 family protein n=1 Tax=Citrobacter enshiensis TaxID=2971264 RepID=A0ABT8PTN1_9ENTR|nr:SMI1/KNR4 family protein [Citrobacter enshiensis]MDN8599680.1 SMI1/KNR4 family protein [Citrobacter enshiensis]
MTRDDLVNLFNEHSDLINMGTSDDGPSQDWIELAQNELSTKFPDDYIWFLKNFGGGEICGEEIYSIYAIPFNEAVGGDIVYKNKIANNNIDNGKIVLSNTDFGEEFFFDTKEMNKVYLLIGNKITKYAENFIEYLYKRVMAYCQ